MKLTSLNRGLFGLLTSKNYFLGRNQNFRTTASLYQNFQGLFNISAIQRFPDMEPLINNYK